MYNGIRAVPSDGMGRYDLAYDVLFPTGDIVGEGKIRFKQVSQFDKDKYFKTDAVFEWCREHNIDALQFIAHILMFYPYGVTPKESDKKQGAATLLLDTILEDSRDAGCRLLYVLATTDSMSKFCEKRFERCKSFPSQYYKLI